MIIIDNNYNENEWTENFHLYFSAADGARKDSDEIIFIKYSLYITQENLHLIKNVHVGNNLCINKVNLRAAKFPKGLKVKHKIFIDNNRNMSMKRGYKISQRCVENYIIKNPKFTNKIE